jgi:exodeoxyribonuclease VII large subunit
MPRRIGVVTSRDGAAFQDFLRTRSLRWAGYPVVLAHTPVQGAAAAAEIARAIGRLDRLGVDVIVVCRGGGSLEDLWAFNELAVAEAVWNSRTPIVSGVGHQTDVSLCDLVADFRAHTPTDAAQTVIPDREALVGDLARAVGDLAQAIDGAILRREEALQRLASARVLRDPAAMLTSRDADLVHLRERLSSATLRRVGRCEAQLSEAHRKLDAHAPRTLLAHSQHAVSSASLRLSAAIRATLERAEQREQVLASQLEAFSPLAILARGYSITLRAGSTEPLLSADGLAVGDELSTRLHRGRVHSRVTRIQPPEA